jgi:hypothetical protein
MAFSDPVILLSTAGSAQKAYRAGEKIGEFEIEGFDRDHLKLGWHGKTFEKNVEELRPKNEPPPPVVTAQNAAPAAAPAAANVTKIGEPAKNDGKPKLGRPVGAFRTCEAGDSSAPGTVMDGYKKVTSVGLMGPECHWEPIK